MNKNNNNSLSTKKGKLGLYATASVLIAIVLLIVVNVLFEAIPKKYTQLDISADKMYTLSAKSTDFLKAIDEDIKIYFVCAGGTIDNQLMTFLSRYEQENKKIDIVVVDPVVDTDFVGKYSADTIDNYSLIVESSLRYRIVNFSELIYYYNEQSGPISPSMYGEYLNYYGNDIAEQFTHYFGGEVVLTGAIEYVLGDVKKVYILSGHNEGEIPTNTAQMLNYADVATGSLNLKTTKKIPDDATALVINAPKTDITADELTLLSSFIGRGGDLFLTTDKNYLELPNLLTLMANYGLSAGADTVADATSAFDNTTKTIIPQTNTAHKLISSMGSTNRLYLQNAHGLKIAQQLPENLTVTELLYTTDAGYYEKDSGTKGRITLGAIAENTTSGAAIVWISSGATLGETFSDAQYYGNPYYFIVSLFYFGDVVFKSALPAISPTELASRVLDVPTSGANFWAITFVFIIPLVFIIIGIVIFVKRKSR